VKHSDLAAHRPVEQRVVSRKTPGDGKLEITKTAAQQIGSLGSAFAVVVNDREGEARLGTMACTCRGDDTPHVHYFVESVLLRGLVPGTSVDVAVDDAGKRLLIVGA
jgi:hypothetical protein